MLYSFKNQLAGTAYDAFRARAAESGSAENSGNNYVDEKLPCLLHPVKPSRHDAVSQEGAARQDPPFSQ